MLFVKTKPFVHLHVHTKYSLLDGACDLEPLMGAALRNGMPAVAMTDHGVMYGAVDFYKKAESMGVRPIVGCEVYVAPRSRLDKQSPHADGANNHLVLLATDSVGYQNLIRLVSLAHLEGFYYKPRIDKDLLSEHARGLIGLSACLKGEVASRLMDDDMAGAAEIAALYADILGRDRFFLEVQDHGLPEQRKVNAHMAELARATGLPIVATNDVHYLEKSHAEAHEVLLCLQTQTVMSDPKRMRYRTSEFFLKTREEMAGLEREFPGCLDITLDIAEQCQFEMEFDHLHFPMFEVPDGKKQSDYLVELGVAGIRRRYGVADVLHPTNEREREILERFLSEKAVIEKTGFVNYFLVVWDFIRFAHARHIPVGPGRGSGGGSLMAYVLGITAIDPLRYGLIFERFLNPERVSPPDFDIDFCPNRRGEVIEYVKEKYGRDSVAQITTFTSLQPKNVIRDVGRALEIPYARCDQWSKMVPEDPKITLRKALEANPEFRKSYETDADCKRILDYAFVLEGLYRNPGVHAAGVVIGEKPLIEIVPLALDKNKQCVTQYTMEAVGDIGLLKMDFLGLKTLTVIQETIDLARATQGAEIDLEALDFKDAKTYELLNRGDTVGVFQLESGGMRDLIRRISIDRIEDLIAMIALYRPGPMNMLEDYVQRKSGKAAVTYEDPLLKPILEETYGIMLYQEQVQKAANVLAGYSLAEGDLLRRAMGKKKESEMEKQRANFIAGCAKTHGISQVKAAKIFDTMAKFAGYGFNKSHSAAYAVIAYQTAYLKANFPCEFMAALISAEMGKSDNKLAFFMNEASAMNIEILPPDINRSDLRFVPEKHGDKSGLRFGLAGIKNVGEAAACAMVAERKKNGSFAGLIDFCSRVDGQTANRRAIESLVRCGAFDSCGMHRARVFNGIDHAMTLSASAQRDRRSGQTSLFDLADSGLSECAAAELPDCESWSESECLAGEKELLGVYMSGHPLTRYLPLLEKYGMATTATFATLADKSLTRVGGILVSVVRKITKTSKESMAILQLGDADGGIEVMVWPDAYRSYGEKLQPDAPVLVCGEVSLRDDPPKMIAFEVYPLEEAPAHFAERVSLHLSAVGLDEARLGRVRELVRAHPGPVPLILCLQLPTGEKVFLEAGDNFRVMPGMDMIAEFEQEFGERSVYVATRNAPLKNARPARRGRASGRG